MNLVKFKNFSLMIDYAHNEGAFIEMKKYMDNIKATTKKGIICGTGDRRDIDIFNIGYYSAQIFDEVIIKHDKNNRGRDNDEMTDLIIEGINKVKPGMPYMVISDEATAVRHALDTATEGSFLVIFADDINLVIEIVKAALQKETAGNSDSLHSTEIAAS
jgi:cyanophycin synthetase